MSALRVLVCGGRKFGFSASLHTRHTPAFHRAIDDDVRDHELLCDTLGAMIGDLVCIVHGGASSADTLAGRWARRYGVPEHVFKANWYPNGRAGGLDRSAGPRRNQLMLAEGKPDLVIGFRGGKGTADMLTAARAADIEVREIAPTPAPSHGEERA